MFIWNANKVIGYTLVLIASISDTNAQSWNLYGNIGYASYSLDELKKYQDFLKRGLIVNATTTEEFPSFITYALGINRQWKTSSLGIEFGHGSTGGRLFYQDYSGKIIADQLVSNNSFSLIPSHILFDKKGLLISVGLKISIVLHSLELNNQLNIGGQLITEQARFKSLNIGFQPCINVEKNVIKSFYIRCSIGYELQSKSEARLTDNPEIFLADENNKPVHLQSNGLRLALGCGIRF
jgi:hypothetical protein